MLPVHVTADSDGHTVCCQPTVQGQQAGPQGPQNVDMPSLPRQTPVQFHSGGGFSITLPVKSGDEGMAVFAARAIDGWWDKGGVQPQAEYRRHNLSDAIYIPGVRSRPNQLGAQTAQRAAGGAAPSTTTLQLRTDQGDVFVEVTETGINIQASSAGKITLTAPLVRILGNLEVTGEITRGADGPSGPSGDRVRLGQHRHQGGPPPDPES